MSVSYHSSWLKQFIPISRSIPEQGFVYFLTYCENIHQYIEQSLSQGKTLESELLFHFRTK